jgi:hypothetical protein
MSSLPAGQVIGTPDFMAPEQWESSGVADERTDLYALGCTLYYLLSGRPPYSGDEYKSLMQKMRGHLADPVPDLRSVRPEVTETVAAVCGRLLAKDPGQRYQTADEVAKAVSAFRDNGALELQERCALLLAERETSAEPEDSGTSIALETEAMPASPARQAPSGHAVFGRPMRMTAAIILLLLIAFGTWFAFHGRTPGPDPQGGGASWDVWPTDKQELPAGWSWRESALVSQTGVTVNNLKLGRLPSPNYRVELDFALEHAYDSLYVMLPLGLRHCFCAIYSYPQKEEIAWSGFGEIDGKKIPLNPSGKSGPLLRQRSPHRLEIDVRLEVNEARLSAVLDGTPLTSWNGPVASLSVPMSYEWPETDLFGIGTINASYRIDRLRVTPLVPE